MIETLKQAGQGWSEILAGRPDWERHFQLDPEGLNTGLIVYGIGVLIAILLASLRMGFPPPGALLILMIAHLVPLVSLVIVTSGMRRLVGLATPSVNFLVPGLFILALMKLIEGLTVLIGITLAGAILAITGFFAYKLARANGLEMPQALGYGIVLFLLLAGLPIALYMLINSL